MISDEQIRNWNLKYRRRNENGTKYRIINILFSGQMKETNTLLVNKSHYRAKTKNTFFFCFSTRKNSERTKVKLELRPKTFCFFLFFFAPRSSQNKG